MSRSNVTPVYFTYTRYLIFIIILSYIIYKSSFFSVTKGITVIGDNVLSVIYLVKLVQDQGGTSVSVVQKDGNQQLANAIQNVQKVTLKPHMVVRSAIITVIHVEVNIPFTLAKNISETVTFHYLSNF